MARSFTVVTNPDPLDKVLGSKPVSKTYQGFDKKFNPASEVEHVILTESEGEIDAWVLDDPKNASGFIEYMASDHYADTNIRIIGVFTRSK